MNHHQRQLQSKFGYIPHFHKCTCIFQVYEQVSHILHRIQQSFVDSTQEAHETDEDDLA